MEMCVDQLDSLVLFYSESQFLTINFVKHLLLQSAISRGIQNMHAFDELLIYLCAAVNLLCFAMTNYSEFEIKRPK